MTTKYPHSYSIYIMIGRGRNRNAAGIKRMCGIFSLILRLLDNPLQVDLSFT